MWGRRLAAMLALYTGKGVAPEVNFRERISRTPPHSSNKAEPTLVLKPGGDVTRSPKQGYQWPHKQTCVQQKFKKKKKKKNIRINSGWCVQNDMLKAILYNIHFANLTTFVLRK